MSGRGFSRGYSISFPNFYFPNTTLSTERKRLLCITAKLINSVFSAPERDNIMVLQVSLVGKLFFLHFTSLKSERMRTPVTMNLKALEFLLAISMSFPE